MRARHYLSFSGNVFKNMNWDEVSTKVATSDEHYLKKLQKTIVKNIDDLFPCDSLLEQIKLLCLYSKPDEQLLKPFKRVFNFENECFILHEKLPPFTFVYSSTKQQKFFKFLKQMTNLFFKEKHTKNKATIISSQKTTTFCILTKTASNLANAFRVGKIKFRIHYRIGLNLEKKQK